MSENVILSAVIATIGTVIVAMTGGALVLCLIQFSLTFTLCMGWGMLIDWFGKRSGLGEE